MKYRAALLLTACFIAITANQPANAQPKGADCSNLVVNKTYAGAFEGYLNLRVYTGQAGLSDIPSGGMQIITFLPQGKIKGPDYPSCF